MQRRFATYVLSALFCTTVVAPSLAESAIPTHCKQGEFAYLNATMATPRRPGTKGLLYDLVKNGRLLSICADRNEEPLGTLFYRYGALRKIELEIQGTAANKVGVFEQQTLPRAGINVFVFKAKNFKYYVIAPYGQGLGVSLQVYRDAKLVTELYSGANASDYEADLFPINFTFSYPMSSPIFESVDERIYSPFH